MEENKDIEVFNVVSEDPLDPDSGRSLVNLIPTKSFLTKRLAEVSHEVNRGRTEKEFNYVLKNDEYYSTLRRLRLQFWNTYNSAISSSTKISVPAIYAGIVSRNAFVTIMECDIRAAFLFTQPHKVKLIQEDLLYEGYRHLDEIMALPVTLANGLPDHKTIAVKLKVIQMMEDRISGSVVQRTQSYEEKVIKKDKDISEDKRAEDLRREIEQIKKSLNKEAIEEAEFKDAE